MDYIRQKCMLIAAATTLVYLGNPLSAPSVEGGDELVRQETQLKGLRQDPRLLLGTATAPYQPPDVGDSRRKAMGLAENVLADSLAGALDAKARSLLRYSDSDRAPAAEKRLRDLLDNFSRRELRRRRVIEFKDYPERGLYTAALFLMRTEVERGLETELGAKRDIVVADVNDASIARMSRDWWLALRSYVAARDNLKFFFDEIPMRAVVTGQTEEVVLAKLVDSRLADLVERIELKPIRGSFAYSSDGRLRAPVEIEALYPFEEGPKPIPDLHLNVSVYKGHGRVGTGRAVTDAWGKAVLPLEWADPSQGQLVLEVSVDTSTLPGLPQLSRAPSRLIPVWRSRTVAFSLLVRADTGRAEIPQLRESLRTLLMQAGFDSVAVDLDSHSLGEEQLEKARDTKADFLLLVDFLAATRKEEEFHMYSSLARTRYAFYTLPDAVQRMDEIGPEGRGKSSNRQTAVSYAVERIQPELLRMLKEKLDKLK